MKSDRENDKDYSNWSWVKLGLFWGLMVFILIEIIFPLVFEDEYFSWKKVIVGFPIWTLVGLAFGYTLKKDPGRKGGNETDGN